MSAFSETDCMPSLEGEEQTGSHQDQESKRIECVNAQENVRFFSLGNLCFIGYQVAAPLNSICQTAVHWQQ